MASLALLILTAITGSLHGLGVVPIPEGSLHVQAGTLGWLTLAVLAIAALLFADGPPPPLLLVTWAPIVAMPLYAAAAWGGVDALEEAAAAIAFASAVGFIIGIAPAVRRVAPLTVPQLAALVAVVILATVPLLDLLPDVSRVGEADWVLFRIAGARTPSIAAFTVLAGMALTEWRLAAPNRPASADVWGLAQVLLFVFGWLTLLVGTTANSLDLLVSNVGFHGLAVAVFLARVSPRLLWSGGHPWFSVGVLYLAAYVGLLGHVALEVMEGRYLELALVPAWVTFGVAHVVSVGVVANGLFGLGSGSLPIPRLVLWAMNIGLAGTALGLAVEVEPVSHTFAAMMGGGIVVGAATALYALRTRSAVLAMPPDEEPLAGVVRHRDE